MTKPQSSFDVFVSYAQADRDRVRPIVDALEAAGLSVWWDRRIAPGAGFDAEIQEALDNSSCVLAVWSKTSISSEWVITEAGEGSERGVLVPVSIDPVRPPLAFRRRQTIDATSSRFVSEDVLAAVRAVLEGRVIEPATTERQRPGRLHWVGGLLVFAALATVVVLLVRALPGEGPASSLKVIRASMPLDHWVGSTGYAQIERTWGITPAGDVVAYVGTDDSEVSAVFVRRIDELATRKLAGTEDASSVFFSPDSTWVGFVRGNRLERVPVEGGATSTIALLEERDFWGVGWGGPEGRVVYSAGRTGLRSVSVLGTDERVLTELDRTTNEGSHRLPHYVPGSSVLLFTIMFETTFKHEVWALDLNTGERRFLFDGLAPSYVESGHIVYAKAEASDRGSLWAVPFDPERMELTGPARAIQSSVGGREGSAYAVALDGTLIYLPSPGNVHAELVLLEPGKSQPRVIAEGHWFERPAFSNDGSQIAVGRRTDMSKAAEIWIYEIEGRGARQLAELGDFPLWDPDDGGITYMHVGTGLVNRRFDQPSAPTTVVSHPQVITPVQWIHGGRDLVYSAVNPETIGDIYILAPEQAPRHIFGRGAAGGSTTRDERWMALCTWPRGVRVGRLPDFTSIASPAPEGCSPIWGADDSLLYYTENVKLWSVDAEFSAASVSFGKRRVVADLGLPGRFQFGVDQSGRVAFVRGRYDAPKPPVLLLNWNRL